MPQSKERTKGTGRIKTERDEKELQGLVAQFTQKPIEFTTPDPYFEEVRSRCDAKWHIGYHSLDDMKRLIALAGYLGLKDVTVFRT